MAGVLLLSCQASWVCGACKDWVGAVAPVSRLTVCSAPGMLSTVPCSRQESAAGLGGVERRGTSNQAV